MPTYLCQSGQYMILRFRSGTQVTLTFETTDGDEVLVETHEVESGPDDGRVDAIQICRRARRGRDGQ